MGLPALSAEATVVLARVKDKIAALVLRTLDTSCAPRCMEISDGGPNATLAPASECRPRTFRPRSVLTPTTHSLLPPG